MQSRHVQAVMRSVAAAFLPKVAQCTYIQPYSNRRFGGTLCGIVKTPPTDAVDYGGWAGVPELAKVATEASDVLMAWKRSMPHLYSDRRAENEEIQKLLHVSMLKQLVARLCDNSGEPRPASWEAVHAKAQEVEAEDAPVAQATILLSASTCGAMREPPGGGDSRK